MSAWPNEACIRQEMARLEKEPCECVTRHDCSGKGYIRELYT